MGRSYTPKPKRNENPPSEASKQAEEIAKKQLPVTKPVSVEVRVNQCEWCESPAIRKYTAKDRNNYVRYCCESYAHRSMVARQLQLDGVKSVSFEQIPGMRTKE